MNLLTDSWMPVMRRDGTQEKVAIWQLLDDYQANPIIDLETPRPDFRNALYQLLIGIIQVAAAPEDEEDWAELWDEPYSSDVFKQKVLKYQNCFEIDSEGPAFMQDYDSKLLQQNDAVSIFRLVMGAPGNITVEEHRDIFVKEEDSFRLDAYWAAITLYVTQITGPPDGGGHRAGLRGSGPLTTLIIPTTDSGDATLWAKLWLNILPREETRSWNGNPEKEIFPWMTHTISSTGGKQTYFDDLHPLSVYWGMAWRVRFVLPTQEGPCHLTGTHSRSTISEHRRLKHGYWYHNLWTSPLSPHLSQLTKEHMAKNKKIAMPATSGNFSYRNWSTLCLGSEQYNRSKLVHYFLSNRFQHIRDGNGCSYQLWASGFHMVPGEATVVNWNEAIMPMVPIDTNSERRVRERCEQLISQADQLAEALTKAIREAWFPPKKKGPSQKMPKRDLSFLTTSFWQNTESDFYQLLDRMVKSINNANVWAECAKQWQTRICDETLALFDQWALAQQEDGLNMRRVVKARNELEKKVGKARKALHNLTVVE